MEPDRSPFLSFLTRWLPAFSMTLVSCLSYIDRNALALLAPTMLRDLNLNNEQYGYAISGFSVAYMVCNPMWGYLLDRAGLRFGMALAVLVWTAASASHALVPGLVGLVAARITLGIGEAATFPGCLRTVVQTLPEHLRARGIAVTYSGGSVGALITPLIITPIMAEWGWRAGFWFTGLVGGAWLLWWASLSRRVTLGGIPRAGAAGETRLWDDRRTWAFVTLSAFGSFPATIVNYQSANFLHAMFGTGQIEIGYMIWIPPLGSEIGVFFWGWITDRFAESGRSLPRLRVLLLVLTLIDLPIAFIPRATSYALALALMFTAMFITAGFIIAATSYATNQFPTSRAGMISGLGGGSNAATAALMMPFVGKLFDAHRHNEAFLIAAVFPAVGFILWYLLGLRSKSTE